MSNDWERFRQDRFVVALVDDENCPTLLSAMYQAQLFAFRHDVGKSIQQMLDWPVFGLGFRDNLGAGVDILPFRQADPLNQIAPKVKAENRGLYPELALCRRAQTTDADGEKGPDGADVPSLDVAAIDLNLRGREAQDNPRYAVEGLWLCRLLSRDWPGATYFVYSAYPMANTLLEPLVIDNEELDSERPRGFYVLRKREPADLAAAIKSVLCTRQTNIVKHWYRIDRERASDAIGRIVVGVRALGKASAGGTPDDVLRDTHEAVTGRISGRWSLGRLFPEVGSLFLRIRSQLGAADPADAGVFSGDPEAQRKQLIDTLKALNNEIRPKAISAGVGTGYAEMRRTIEWASGYKIPILILGPIGSGKTTLAEEIHQLSGRNGALLKLNCAEYLDVRDLQHALFGVVERAFTEVKARDGLAVEADHGTLFLDEIHMLPPQLCGSLLRFLDEMIVRPLGGGRRSWKKVDVRLLCATSEDLHRLVQQERFSAALFSRLSILSVLMPALRDRSNDIPDLVSRFRTEWATEHHVDPPAFSAAAIAELQRREWHYNIRELKGFVQITLALARHERRCLINPEHLAAPVAEQGASDDELVLEMVTRWLASDGETSLDKLRYRYGIRALVLLMDRIRAGRVDKFQTITSLADALGVTEAALQNVVRRNIEREGRHERPRRLCK
ncbi:sigma 54-interacting transcriptional regulator [Sorangium sp. So ce381]|uniref:sigma 54-interacting transcriptional regulator n=1 Tax=Sorangium sp. So ce381 TaxID=3133307 RepID=UPI003F5B82E4